jgi:hypothetical protein
MNERGERLLVAAMVQPVEQGETFGVIPAHMTVIGWLTPLMHQRHFLDNALENVFKQDYFQETVGGRHLKYGEDHNIPVREMRQVERAPWIALHALAKSLQMFPADDKFIDIFSPHVSDTHDYKAARGEKIAFPMVALISRSQDKALKTKRVEAVYPLGEYRQHEDAA